MRAPLLFLVLLCVPGIQADDLSASIVMNRILKHYDRREPPYQDQSTVVKIGIYINGFYGISSNDMEYSMNFYVRQSWSDPRLAIPEDFGKEKIRCDNWDQIWKPDLFFRNEKKGEIEETLSPHRLVTLNTEGGVRYVTKYTSTLSCPMKLQKFPFDTQTCSIKFESWLPVSVGYTMDVMSLHWLDSPVDMDPQVQMPEFTLTDTILYDCSQNYTAGAFPCLEIMFVLERDTGYYVMAVFIPSMVLVMTSWIQFWLEPSAVTGRLLTGLFCLVTLVGQMTGVRASMPKVSYLTSLDVWLTACLLFTFSSLLQLALVQLLTRMQGESVQEKSTARTHRVDFVSRIAFPACFLLFCIIYFPLYAL